VIAAVCLLMLSVVAPEVARRPASLAPDPAAVQAAALDDRAYQAAYNLDYDQAIALARQAVSAEPDDARAHRTLAVVLWLDIIFVRGAVTIDSYLDGVVRATATLTPAPAGLDAECRAETQRAIDLAEAWTRRAPESLDARFELGTAYALRASYVASVTGNMSSAFGSARHAYDAEDSVLDHDPSRTSAAVVVGLYRYVVSTLALPSRLFAYVAGFGGDKAKGIHLLETAAVGGEGHVEASVALLLIYAREGRHLDALRIASRLEQEFPRNRLFTLEAGSAAVRAGRGAEADGILTRGLQALASDSRPRFPGERSVWLLKRGMARTEMGRYADARADLGEAAAAAPPGWVSGRIHLQLGRVADLEGRRADAIAEYRESKRLCSAAHNGPCVDDANRGVDKPYRGKADAPK
jgi:tetratricopeptide (TPR) repeat protein